MFLRLVGRATYEGRASLHTLQVFQANLVEGFRVDRYFEICLDSDRTVSLLGCLSTVVFICICILLLEIFRVTHRLVTFPVVIVIYHVLR